MTQEEIVEYNKRCAEFLGLTIITDGISWFDTDYKALKHYHSDWNWIMEVVEAIEKIDRNDEHGLFRLIRYGASCNWNNLPPSINANTPKEAVVQAINQFLIWYNKNVVL